MSPTGGTATGEGKSVLVMYLRGGGSVLVMYLLWGSSVCNVYAGNVSVGNVYAGGNEISFQWKMEEKPL